MLGYSPHLALLAGVHGVALCAKALRLTGEQHLVRVRVRVRVRVNIRAGLGLGLVFPVKSTLSPTA